MTINTFLDEEHLRIAESPAGKRHIEGWFGETLCGKYANYGYNAWSYRGLTSLRSVGKMAQAGRPVYGWCKRCLAQYKDVNINAD